MSGTNVAKAILSAAARHKATLLAAAVCGAILGASIAGIRGPQWESAILLQIGQVGASDKPLVNPEGLASRLNHEGFVDQLCRAAGYLQEGQPADKRCGLIRKTIQAKVASKDGNLVDLRVRATTQAEAKAVAEKALEIVAREHEGMLAPSVTRMKKSLSEVTENIRTINDERNNLFSAIKASGTSPDRKFSENVLLSNLMKTDDAQLRALRLQQDSLVEQLSDSRTFNTKAAAPIYVPQRPATSSVTGMAIQFAMLGFLVALAAIAILDPQVRKETLSH